MIRGVFAPLLSFACIAFAQAQNQPPQPPNASRAQCLQMRSAILKRGVRYCVILPPRFNVEPTRKFPVVYYLHGLGDNAQALVQSDGWDLVEHLWEDGKAGRFVIATPDAWDTFYVNAKDGTQPYEDFFIKEFIPEIEKRFRGAGTRAGRGIAGFSMGGYGALRLAFKYPGMFAAVTAHSAALDEDRSTDITSSTRGLRAFGTPFDANYWKQNSPFTLARSAPARLRGLKIYFDCGLQDDFGLAAGATALHQLLQQLGVPHEFHLFPGNHSWGYVEKHFADAMVFQSRALSAFK